MFARFLNWQKATQEPSPRDKAVTAFNREMEAFVAFLKPHMAGEHAPYWEKLDDGFRLVTNYNPTLCARLFYQHVATSYGEAIRTRKLHRGMSATEIAAHIERAAATTTGVKRDREADVPKAAEGDAKTTDAAEGDAKTTDAAEDAAKTADVPKAATSDSRPAAHAAAESPIAGLVREIQDILDTKSDSTIDEMYLFLDELVRQSRMAV